MDYWCSGLEIVNAEQAPHVEVAAEPGILQRVDDHRCATPRRGGGVDQLPCCHGLATGVDPVVDAVACPRPVVAVVRVNGEVTLGTQKSDAGSPLTTIRPLAASEILAFRDEPA